jgi:glycerol uptake facilitator protein
MRHPTMVERFLAEALGTFLLVFIGGGTAAVTALSNLTPQGSGAASLVLVALAHGLALFIIVLIVGRVSGAHVNPSITLGLAFNGHVPWEEVPAYLIGQIVGGTAGAAAILIVYGQQAATIGRLGAPSLATNTSLLQGLLSEGMGAGILMLAIISTAVDTRSAAGWAGLTIGLALGAIIMVIGPATGAAVNPARAFGPDFVDFLLGVKVDWLAYVVVYLIGPILGASGAAALYGVIAHYRAPRLSRR